MATADLVVLDGGDVGEVGSAAWSEKLRTRARELSGVLETGYMELGRLLWLACETPQGNQPGALPVYRSWGYYSFGDYAERELNLHRRKAERLRSVWAKVEALPGIDFRLKQRLSNMGWSKMRELVRILTPTNCAQWVDKAEEINCEQLYALVTEADRRRNALAEAKKTPALVSTPVKAVAPTSATPPAPQAPQPAPGPIGVVADTSPPVPTSSSVHMDAPPEEVVVAEEDLPPPETYEKLSRRSYLLYPDQVEIVDAAIKRAGELGNSKAVVSSLLTMICTDFLATNDFGKNTRVSTLKFLHKYERLFGLRIAVFDPITHDIIYGQQTIEDYAGVTDDTPTTEEK